MFAFGIRFCVWSKVLCLEYGFAFGVRLCVGIRFCVEIRLFVWNKIFALEQGFAFSKILRWSFSS